MASSSGKGGKPQALAESASASRIGGWMPQRWRMIILITVGVLISYTLRVNISMSSIEMQRTLQWKGNEKGLILSAFYIGYAVGQVPAAFAAQWLGAKRVLGLSVLLTSLLSMLFPPVIERSFPMGFALRILIGLSASATFPSCYYFYKSWVPKAEKMILLPFVTGGVYLGEILAFSASGALIRTERSLLGFRFGGWQATFWTFALMGFAWYPVWRICAYEKPEDDPGMTAAELAFIRKDQIYNTIAAFDEEQALLEDSFDRNVSGPAGSNGDKNASVSTFAQTSPKNYQSICEHVTVADCRTWSPMSFRDRADSIACSIIADTKENERDSARRIPWGQFLVHPMSRMLLFTWWVVAWIGFMMLSEIPSFLTEHLGYNIDEAGFVSVAPYIAKLVSSLGFGYVFTFLERSRWNWSTRRVRQWAQFIALGGSSSCLLICSFISRVELAVFFLVLALFFYGATQSGLSCAFLDVSPNYSYSLNSFANMVGAVAGIVSPLVVSSLTSGSWIEPTWGWRVVFLFTAFQCLIALYFWNRFQIFEVVPELNSPRPRKSVTYKEWCPWLRV